MVAALPGPVGPGHIANMKIFIAGSRGQFGRDALRRFEPGHELLGLDRPELDIADPGSVRDALDAFRPDVIVNAAGYTRVDDAETERDAARRANAGGPRVLAEYARDRGGFLAHISTDYVFDGTRPPPEPYVETDLPKPLSWYGVTKLEGERAVRETTDRHLILRTAWLYGAGGRNFLRTILAAALRRPAAPLCVVNDQWGTPTWSWRLAEQLEKALGAGARGVVHATAEGFCTWHEVAVAFFRLMNVERDVRPCATAEYPTPARRPANAILENARLKADGLNVMRPWREDLAEFVRQHGDNLRKEASP